MKGFGRGLGPAVLLRNRGGVARSAPRSGARRAIVGRRLASDKRGLPDSRGCLAARGHVRSSPESGSPGALSPCPRSANFGLLHRSVSVSATLALTSQWKEPSTASKATLRCRRRMGPPTEAAPLPRDRSVLPITEGHAPGGIGLTITTASAVRGVTQSSNCRLSSRRHL
jgi:hypothetical protein